MCIDPLILVKRPPLTRADFPVSGENVRAVDKRGAGPAGLSFCDFSKMTGGEMQLPLSPKSKISASSPQGELAKGQEKVAWARQGEPKAYEIRWTQTKKGAAS